MRTHLPRRAAVAAGACVVVAGGALAIAGVGGGHSTPAADASSAPTTSIPSKPMPRHGHGGLPFFGGGHAFGGSGTVASVTAGGFTVKGPGATFSYTTTSSTTYEEVGVPVSRSQLTDGARVVVRSAPSTSPNATTRAAAAVDIVLPEVEGKVVSISGSQLILQDGQGFWRTVDIASTAYGQDGKTASASTMKTGEYVLASGTIASDHTTLDASAVNLLGTAPVPPNAAFGPGGPGGFPGPGGQGRPWLPAGPPAGPPAAGGSSTT